jgi:pilus assembly protein Flp/PilA
VLLVTLEYTMFKFLKDKSGATAIEYGLIAAAIGLVLVVVMPTVGSALNDLFNDIASNLD